ncbi:hypothetical protein [Nocardia vermiculata]|uniref:Tetratricopeptide repeat protein n=1 Tax=Nocardia vermiculata TaxID=257274 RepID=A0A846Y8C5_9NOCA|nr:hypothetical protein [Nocardia vermiculata]
MSEHDDGRRPFRRSGTGPGSTGSGKSANERPAGERGGFRRDNTGERPSGGYGQGSDNRRSGGFRRDDDERRSGGFRRGDTERPRGGFRRDDERRDGGDERRSGSYGRGGDGPRSGDGRRDQGDRRPGGFRRDDARRGSEGTRGGDAGRGGERKQGGFRREGERGTGGYGRGGDERRGGYRREDSGQRPAGPGQRPDGPGRGEDRRRGGEGARVGSEHRAGRPDEPALPEEVQASDLEGAVRRDLLSLDKNNAETVARHLVMAAQLLDEDPELALEHARAARRRAGRIAVVRETAGVIAYHAGEWAEALSELRTARRMAGGSGLLAVMADCERGLGRPERAIELGRSDEARELSGAEATELRIVVAGARMDLGQYDQAVVTLQTPELDPAHTGPASARLFYAYAEALLAAERPDEALQWFLNTAAADIDGDTDAEERADELAAAQADDDAE